MDHARGIVEVRYRDRLGNNLSQYCLGRILATQLDFDLFAHPIPGFPNATGMDPSTLPPDAVSAQLLEDHRIDLAGVLGERTPRRIVLHGYFQRYEYYRPHKTAIRDSWLVSDVRHPSAPDVLTIHIRAGDLWQRRTRRIGIHPDYHALPFSFYRAIVEERPWSSIVVVTSDPLDAMVRKLASSFGATVCSGSEIEDFNLLRASSNLVLSVSSYAWWAGWLSPAARIYYPIAGLFDEDRMRRVGPRRPPPKQPDLRVRGEDRYIDVRPPGVDCDWTGSETERQRLLAS